MVEIDQVGRLAGGLAGVRRTAREGLAEWRYHGRLVARQLDDEHVVIRADFDYRDLILRQHPATFSVPNRWVKHMMVVADSPPATPGQSRMRSKKHGSCSAMPGECVLKLNRHAALLSRRIIQAKGNRRPSQ